MSTAQCKPNDDVSAKAHVKPGNDPAVYGRNTAAAAHARAASAALGHSPLVTAVHVLVSSFTSFARWDGFRMGIAWIRRRLNCSRSTVDKALRTLRLAGLIARDGMLMVDDQYGVMVYRKTGTPEHPLPVSVLAVRDPDRYAVENGSETAAKRTAVTCTFTHSSTIKDPRGPVCTNTYLLLASRSPRSDAVASSYVSTRMRAERETIPPYLATIPDITNRMTPGQTRRAVAVAVATMRRCGLSAARMAARIRSWWAVTVRSGRPVGSPLGWLWHAIEAAPYGCPDPRCEDGDLWDGDRITGRCGGCSERRRDRAAAKRSGNGPTASVTAPWVPAWVAERADARAALTAFVTAPAGQDGGIVRPDDSLPPETGIGYSRDQRGGDHHPWRLHVYRYPCDFARHRHQSVQDVRHGKAPHGVPLPTRTPPSRPETIRGPAPPIPRQLQGLPPRIHASTANRQGPTRRSRIPGGRDKTHSEVLS